MPLLVYIYIRTDEMKMFRAVHPTRNIFIPAYYIILGRCLQHRGGEPEQAKGADGMQLFALDCIAHIGGAETD